MDFKRLQHKAKQLIEKRGGTESVKADAKERKNIAKGADSIADKAKRAGDALKDPGAKGPTRRQCRPRPPPPRGQRPVSRPHRPPTSRAPGRTSSGRAVGHAA